MDHLPLPKSALAHLRIACISKGDYDDGPFLSFPTRQNWEITLFKQSIEEGVSHGGTPPSVAETQSFLQTWLYFGTLREIFGESMESSDFIAIDEDGSRFLCTTNIKRVANNCLDRSSNAAAPEDMQREALVLLCNHIRRHLDTLYHVLAGMQDLTDSGTVTATAILGECMENFYRVICQEILKIETPPYILWGTVFSGWIIKHMESSGWCPSVITRLAMDRPRISVLYYCCQLPPPQAARDHTSCTKDFCLTLKIEPSTYCTTHTTISCDCPELALDVEKIGKSLKESRLPLIEISPHGDPAHANISFRKDDVNVGFVAISHVWADGLGNVNNNSLPACSLQEISRLVSRLPRTVSQQTEVFPFWIDTVCVPVEPVELKQLALRFLRHPYMNAEHVLVLDNYLRTTDAEDCDVLEIFARVACSNWVGRLWTLQEGRLAKRIWFQFRDKAIELKALWEATKRPRNKGWDYWDMLVDSAVKWNATDLWGPRRTDLRLDITSLNVLRSALCFRSVSVPADEALCLFCLTGLSLENFHLVPAQAHLRMRVFWSHMRAVPSGLLFSKCPEKLDEPGLRWAPLSFMRVLRRNHWAGIVKFAEDLEGVPTPHGLQAKFPGFICEVTSHGLEDIGGFFFGHAGDWFELYLEGPWHAKSPFVPPSGPQKMAVILMESLNHRATRELYDELREPRWNDHSDGILGLTTHEDASVKYVKSLYHVTVRVMKPRKQVIYDAAHDCILKKVLDKHDTYNLNQQAMQATETYFNEHATIRDACQTWALGSIYTTGQDRFAALLVEMITPSQIYGGIAGEVPDNQCWCVD